MKNRLSRDRNSDNSVIVTSSDGIVGNHYIAHHYKKLHPRIIRDNKILKCCVHANINNSLVNKQRTGVFCENFGGPGRGCLCRTLDETGQRKRYQQRPTILFVNLKNVYRKKPE